MSGAQLPSLDLLGAELDRAARERPRRRRAPSPALALVAVALLVGAAFTPPGRAVADAVGKLVGIGEPSTFDHTSDPEIPAAGGSVVLDSGRAPGDGPRFELVAFAGKAEGEEQQFVGGSARPTCLSLDFPELPGERPEFNGRCAGGSDTEYTLRADSSTDTEGELGPATRYTVSGVTSDAIDHVEATYVDASGERVPASVAYGLAAGDVLEEIGAERAMGMFVVFLPDDDAPNGTPGDHPARHLQTLEVTGYAADGSVVAVDHYGAMLSRGRRERRDQESGTQLVKACLQARAEDGAPRICKEVLENAREHSDRDG